MQTPFSNQELRRAFSCFATGVTVITGIDQNGKPVGITISSFNTVSLNPPLVLWSIGSQSDLCNSFRIGQKQLIHVLDVNQKDLALVFAKQLDKNNIQMEHQIKPSGLMRLANCLAYFECETIAVHEGGDHHIIVARVLSIEQDSDRHPLLFAQSQFNQLALDPEGSIK
ncbi:MAG: flavin reductase family protein [Limnohabitans sp.]|nr:flavin reductase family protein [Limnohabitans sp.]